MYDPEAENPSLFYTSSGLKAAEDETTKFNPTNYRKAMGSLLHLANDTRPDIAYAVCMQHHLSQFNQNPTTQNWTPTKHLFRYLQGSKELSFCYKRNAGQHQTFVDADWANDKQSRSVTVYVTILAGAAVGQRKSK